MPDARLGGGRRTRSRSCRSSLSQAPTAKSASPHKTPARTDGGREYSASSALRTALVLSNVNGTLAVYRVRNDGMLKGLRRPPRDLAPTGTQKTDLRGRQEALGGTLRVSAALVGSPPGKKGPRLSAIVPQSP